MREPKTRQFDTYLIEDDNYNEVPVNYQGLEFNLDGHNLKGFVLCESEFFREFFDEIENNPNASYITYLNEFIKDNYDGINLPIEEISCFKKDSIRVRIEEIVSRLANALKIPTAYVKSVIPYTPDELKAINKHMINDLLEGKISSFKPQENYMLSIDFIGKNEHFHSLNEYYGNKFLVYKRCSLGKWYSSFMNCTLKNPLTHKKLTHNEKWELFRQFIPQYIFRTYIARDYDFKSENVGIIYDEVKNCYKLSPMFDFEQCYYYADTPIDQYALSADLELAYKLCPEETADILRKLNNLDIDKFIDTHVNDDDKIIDYNSNPKAKQAISKTLHDMDRLIYRLDYNPIKE